MDRWQTGPNGVGPFKVGAIRQPVRNLAQERRLAEIDEMLAMKARYDALMRQAQARPKVATRPTAANRTQGSRQVYERTTCESCNSSLVLSYGTNALQCQVCRHISPRFTTIDTRRYPGESSCKHCHSIAVVFHEKTLYCRVCGGSTPRWG